MCIIDYSSASDSDEEDMLIALLFLNELIEEAKILNHDSMLSGNDYYNELMETDIEARFRSVCRMDKNVFLPLLEELQTAGLSSSDHISAGEKLVMFMLILKRFTK